MPKSEKQFTKKDFENAFEKLILSISTKPTLFRNFIDLEGIRDGCARLVLFIEGCPEDEKSRLFSTLAEILLVSRLVHTTEMGRIFARKQRLAASRAREAKKTKSQSANEIISKSPSGDFRPDCRVF
jgi:hypothetical protein